MRLIGPEDMKDFHCRAGACRHSCCRGWEIDVDEDSRRRYAEVDGPLGERLRESLETDETGTHFRLDAEERCPFLNQEGLCDLILQLGEEALCQICRDHPRYRNFFSDHTEIGLGMVCEAAAEQIVKREAPFRWTLLEDDGIREEIPEEEQWLQEARDRLMLLAQDRKRTIGERRQAILQSEQLPDIRLKKGMLDRLLALETLDAAWPGLLAQAGESMQEQEITDELEKPAEQILCYLLCRHLPGTLDDGLYRERVLFCLLALELIFRTASVLPLEGKRALMEAARLFSGEIEYSDENMETILEDLSEFLEHACRE